MSECGRMLFRYWAIAVPIYLWVLLVYSITIYNAVNLMNNNSFESYYTIRGKESYSR